MCASVWTRACWAGRWYYCIAGPTCLTGEDKEKVGKEQEMGCESNAGMGEDGWKNENYEGEINRGERTGGVTMERGLMR